MHERLEDALERLEGFLNGNEHYPGVLPEDIETGFFSEPEGVRLKLHGKRLEAELLSHRLRVGFVWNGSYWMREQNHETLPDPATLLLEEIRRVAERLERLEAYLKERLGE